MDCRFKIFSFICIWLFTTSGQLLFSQSSSHKDDESSINTEKIENKLESEPIDLNDSAISNSTFLFNQMFLLRLHEGSLLFQRNRKGEGDDAKFSELFKYDISPENHDHRCYEIVAPLAKNYNLHFNFMSLEKFTLGGSR